jgi:hypothetical protein
LNQQWFRFASRGIIGIGNHSRRKVIANSFRGGLNSRTRFVISWGVSVNYKQYLIETFEREPTRWRARIKRLDGRNIRVHVPQMEHASFTTPADASTPETAVDLAKKAIDAGRMI